jgi:xylose isomerase
MTYQNAVLLGTLGRFSDRFHEYQPAKTLSERLELAVQIPRVHGIEPVYPQDLGANGEQLGLIQDCGLAVSAVNVNLKGEAVFRYGSLTSPDASVRTRALEYLTTAMDLAAELNTDMVSVCPLIDGHDHCFQVDYLSQWRWLVEGLQAACAHRSDIRISLEYKPFEVRNYIVLPNITSALYLCEVVGADNLGVTMDVGHALNAGETPAQAFCLAQQAGRLFYLHFNDNNRAWDWDMLVASVNLWDTLETLYYVRKAGWRGWCAYDVFTRHGDPAKALEVTFRTMERLEQLLDKIGMDRLGGLVQSGIPAVTFDTLIGGLL